MTNMTSTKETIWHWTVDLAQYAKGSLVGNRSKGTRQVQVSSEGETITRKMQTQDVNVKIKLRRYRQ